jgi:hypothetical protein
MTIAADHANAHADGFRFGGHRRSFLMSFAAASSASVSDAQSSGVTRLHLAPDDTVSARLGGQPHAPLCAIGLGFKTHRVVQTENDMTRQLLI